MSANNWYLVLGGQQAGPMSIEEVKSKLASGEANEQTLAFTAGMENWTAISNIPQLNAAPAAQAAPRAAAPKAAPAASAAPRATAARTSSPAQSHEVDYEVFGTEMQFIEVELDPGETVIAEAGSMMFMEDGIEMETRFGDGSEPDKGMMGKLFEGVKRKFTGESLFMTWFTNQGHGKKRVGFGAPYPGKIVPLNLAELGNEFICQKDSFLAAAMGTKVDIALNKKIGAGFFGGEGFIMQRLQGDGMAFVHAGGTIKKQTLSPGETLRVDTGCIVGYTPGVSYDIQTVGGVKSMIFGGEGLFFATLTGPGDVWLQSLPFSRLAGRMLAAAPQTGGGGKGEGSVLGSLGNLIGGD